MNAKTKDVLIRALKTFWEAALGYLLADAALLREALTVPLKESILVTLFVGAAAAGFSAIYNGIIGPSLPKVPKVK